MRWGGDPELTSAHGLGGGCRSPAGRLWINKEVQGVCRVENMTSLES